MVFAFFRFQNAKLLKIKENSVHIQYKFFSKVTIPILYGLVHINDAMLYSTTVNKSKPLGGIETEYFTLKSE